MFTRFHSRGFAAKQAAAWKENWCFAVSAFCFLCLYLNATTFKTLAFQLFCTLLAALAAGCMTAALPMGCLELVKKAGWQNWLLAGLSALGLCQSGCSIFYNFYLPSGIMAAIASRLSLTSETLLRAAGTAGAICGFPALFAALSLFYHYFLRSLRKGGLFEDLRSWEKGLYLALLALFFLCIAAAYTQSSCFYAGDANGGYNKIYSLDCGIVMELQGSAFLNLRQHITKGCLHALFPAFAAPFAAIPSLLSLPFSPVLKPLLIQTVQAGLLLLAYLMLARLLKLTPAERAWFLFLCCAAYPSLLFSVAMEKFIFFAFWSVLFLYASQEGAAPDLLPLTACGGSLACGVLLLPLSTLPLLRKAPRRWLSEMVRGAAVFLLSLVALGHLDALLPSSSIANVQYFDIHSPLLYRFQQYTAFVSSCFLAPDAGPTLYVEKWDAWWMLPVTSVNLVGLAVLILCAVIFWGHRREFIAQVSAGWIAVSFVLLCLLGWDLRENSLVLFSLCFSWAFWALLFLPAKRLRGRNPLLLHALCAVPLCLLLARNLPQMAALLRFAAGAYPTVWRGGGGV